MHVKTAQRALFRIFLGSTQIAAGAASAYLYFQTSESILPAIAAPAENGHWKFNLAKAEELQSFSRMWARNLSQGFATGNLF